MFISFCSPQTLVRALRYACNEYSLSLSSCCTISLLLFLDFVLTFFLSI
jgi:hypothetical protein